MDKEEFARVRLGELYVKDFKIATVKSEDNYWRVKREVTLTNSKEESIPILKEEAQGIMKLLDKCAVLEDV